MFQHVWKAIELRQIFKIHIKIALALRKSFSKSKNRKSVGIYGNKEDLDSIHLQKRPMDWKMEPSLCMCICLQIFFSNIFIFTPNDGNSATQNIHISKSPTDEWQIGVNVNGCGTWCIVLVVVILYCVMQIVKCNALTPLFIAVNLSEFHRKSHSTWLTFRFPFFAFAHKIHPHI